MRQERTQSINLGREFLEKAWNNRTARFPPLRKNEDSAPWPKNARSTPWRTLTRTSDSGGFPQAGDHKAQGKARHRREKRSVRVLSAKWFPDQAQEEHPRIKVKGLDDLLVRMANCCHPLPGEPVIGF